MKHLFLLCAATCTGAWAQVPLTRLANELRNGDRLCKVQVSYVTPGMSGLESVWQLGTINKQSQDFIQSIASNGDTIAVFEPDRIEHYLAHGDTLWYKGEQQRRTYRICQEERPMIHYPFSYGDSIGGIFFAKGIDEGIDLTVQGSGHTVADGMGILTDGTDTLRHILRLHLHDDYTEDYGGQVQLHYLRDRYQWFMAGLRYPVQESISWSLAEGDSTLVPVDSITYLYLPVQQSELAEDVVNDSIRQNLLWADAQGASFSSGISGMTGVSAVLSPDGRTLTVNYTLTEGKTSLSFLASDIVGNTLGHASRTNLTEGEYTETITLSRRPVGNALMLHIESGNENQSMKVYQ